MTYEVLRGFTANGRIYRAGDRVEGAELKHEGQMAVRRLIKLVSQAEATVPTQRSEKPLEHATVRDHQSVDRTGGRR